eukprot:366444-Chlamydomonas_euryale.AAC.4
MTEQEKCQSIFRNLLVARGQVQNQSSCAYVRELTCTERCDKFFDMSHIHKSYAELVGTPAMERIRDYKETEEDERRAEQAVIHDSVWTTQNLESALTWRNWLWYQSVDRVERMVSFATFGAAVGTAGFSGWRFVRSRHRKWSSQKPKPTSELAS